MSDEETVIHTPFGSVKIRHGEVSPVSQAVHYELLIGQTYLEQFFEELWKSGFSLKEVVISATGFCPECKRSL